MYETLEELRGVTLFTVAPLCDGDLLLHLVGTEPLDETVGRVPTYRFDMHLQGVRHAVGGISLRIANTDHIVNYLGHIGYHVEPAYRGRHLAARSCRLLLPLARRHGLNPLWITCNPDNWASRRTCELAGARLVEIVNVPPDNPIYLGGEPRKCRYRLDTMG
ncbi:MAG: GNAT family N-acetyltransferase [Anaerolineae bacterium]|nr:GNAT family N-acetyltransferase [Candidatus Roseilinea sp.]MDW8449020.1 GNAT family N-acetyltransferase [Anaerolineae bacterium]